MDNENAAVGTPAAERGGVAGWAQTKHVSSETWQEISDQRRCSGSLSSALQPEASGIAQV